VSDFGTYITMIAVQLLVIDRPHATPAQAGLVSAARWVPYLAFGLFAGVYVDRHRRRPVLIGTDLGRAVLLGLIPLLAVTGGLTVYLIAALMIPVGVLALLNDAACQSFVSRLLPPAALNQGYARLEQSNSAAQASGPLVGGALVALLTAPFAVLVDAAS
jgi:MFS family permease